jgi:hypothetical protein
MSALGHKRTSKHVRIMSALPPKADIVQHGGHVRFVPKADIPSFTKLLPNERPERARANSGVVCIAHLG